MYSDIGPVQRKMIQISISEAMFHELPPPPPLNELGGMASHLADR